MKIELSSFSIMNYSSVTENFDIRKQTRLYCFNWGRGVNVIIFQFPCSSNQNLFNCPLFEKIYCIILTCTSIQFFFFGGGGIYPLMITVFQIKKTLIQDADIFVICLQGLELEQCLEV